jgi:photolyase PhrII
VSAEPLQMLPAHLQRRIDPNAPSARAGNYVVYWMRIAARADENPALDVALVAAKALGLPVFVYHALSQRYRYASDRIHMFALQGARDVQAALSKRGIGYAFHLQTPDDDKSHLETIARQAALIVADYMPVQPLLRWTEAIAQLAPVWNVDASLIAPIWQFSKSVDRAFEFRKMATPIWDGLVTRPYQEQEPPCDGPFVPPLPFVSIDLQRADLAALTAHCAIDHSIAPVAHTVGGSVAAKQRWASFAAQKLARYHKDRNDPLRDGHSRMSAYLHFGHISPFQIARDCAAAGNEGSQKYLDELLVWRELAWHFCWHHRQAFADLDGVFSLVPSWARQTLAQREADSRTVLYFWDQLARAQTADALWNACQTSLLVHGELHNNVRMTWGKAFLQWTPNAKAALGLMIDLNHRYALDGRDPSSYAGMLWCLGGLDRPFEPPQPITGAVRSRDLAHHAHRMNVQEFSQRMAAPTIPTPLRVAVIGAGIAGAAAARTLQDAGHCVTVFDKGRGVGGRLATRRGDNDATFDHGAQYFTVKDERFANVCRALWQEGIVAKWSPAVASIGKREQALHRKSQGTTTEQNASEPAARLVAVPGMSALVQRLLRNLDVRMEIEIAPLSVNRLANGKRTLHDIHGTAVGDFDTVVVTAPAPQAMRLIASAAPELAAVANRASYFPCIAVFASFAQALATSSDALFINQNSPLSWAARNSSKPGRPQTESWVLHASATWSQSHLEQDPSALQSELLSALFTALAIPSVAPISAAAHRWRYALVKDAINQDCLFDSDIGIAMAGDWCLGGRIEKAYLSGIAAAGRINGFATQQNASSFSPYKTLLKRAQIQLL